MTVWTIGWVSRTFTQSTSEKFEDTKGVIRRRSTKHYKNKLEIEQHESHLQPGVKAGAPEGKTVKYVVQYIHHHRCHHIAM